MCVMRQCGIQGDMGAREKSNCVLPSVSFPLPRIRTRRTSAPTFSLSLGFAGHGAAASFAAASTPVSFASYTCDTVKDGAGESLF